MSFWMIPPRHVFLTAFTAVLLLGCGAETIVTAQDAGAEAAANSKRASAAAKSQGELAVKLDAALAPFLEKQLISGAVVQVMHHDQIIHTGTYGVRTIAGAEPIGRDTIFRIYSMTKPITCAAAMKLVEQGKLGLDDCVTEYLPELDSLELFTGFDNGKFQTKAIEKQITIRDLMRHTSGFTYGLFGKTPVDQAYVTQGITASHITLDEMVRRLAKIPLLHPPQERFHYGVSTDVLGRVIEVVSEKPLDEFLQTTLFEPLGMKDTGFYVPKSKHGRLSGVYSMFGGRLVDASAFNTHSFLSRPEMLSGGGGLVSTIDDYMAFCRMMIQDGEFNGKQILDTHSISEMTKNQLADELLPFEIMGRAQRGVGFGFGVQVGLGTAGPRLGEYAWNGAASTHFWISPKDDLAVVVLSQIVPYNGQLVGPVKRAVYEWLSSHRQ